MSLLSAHAHPYIHSLSAYLAFELDDHCLFARILAKYLKEMKRPK
jgi:hypothetical protein